MGVSPTRDSRMMQLTQFSPMPVSILLTVSLLHGPFRMISTQLDTMLRLLPIPQELPSGSMLPSWTLVTLLSTTLSFTRCAISQTFTPNSSKWLVPIGLLSLITSPEIRSQIGEIRAAAECFAAAAADSGLLDIVDDVAGELGVDIPDVDLDAVSDVLDVVDSTTDDAS